MVEKFISEYKNRLRYDGRNWYIKTGNSWELDKTKRRYDLVMNFFIANSGRICTPCKLAQVKKLLAAVKKGLTGSVCNG